MSRREFYAREKLLRLEAVAKLYNSSLHMRSAKIRRALLNDYLNDLRACRKINVKQWELGRSLADQWHGTAEDFVTAVKELA
jgi:hypothetical protein